MKLGDQLADLPAGFRAVQEDSQHVFRQVMEAFSRPGTVREIVPTGMRALETVVPSMAAIGLALPGSQTPVWLSPTLADQRLMASFLGFHSGCHVVSNASDATYAFVHAADLADIRLSEFPWGTDIEPHLGATVVLAVERLAPLPEDSGMDLIRLSGPGVNGSCELGVRGLSDALILERIGAADAFPRGVDLMLCAENLVAVIPRSAVLEVN